MTDVNFYLAARFTRRDEIAGCAAELRSLGYAVTSRWHTIDQDVPDNGVTIGGTTEDRQRIAEEDLADLRAADLVISFTENSNSPYGRGGRHVEFGVALQAGKDLIVVGPRENLFHWLDDVEWFPTWQAFLDVYSTPLESLP